MTFLSSFMPHPKQSTQLDLLTLASYVTLVAVGTGGIVEIELVWQRWLALLLLIFFAVLLPRTTRPEAGFSLHRANIYLAVQTILVSLLLLFVPGSFLFGILFFILSAIAMLLNPVWVAVLWIALFTLISGVTLVNGRGWVEGLMILLPFIGGYFFFGVFANALNRARMAQMSSDRLLNELRLANQQLQEYANQVETLAVMEERSYLAREMHDTIGHRLTVAVVQLEGAQRLIPKDPERAANMIGAIRVEVREALKDLRQTVTQLRQPLEGELTLLQTLPRLAASFEKGTGLLIHLDLPEALPAIPGPHRLALYRAAQEGLTNVQRHASAKEVWLQLSLLPGQVVLTISDNGSGFSSSGDDTGFGLRGLRERAAQLGGVLIQAARPGGGARLSFHIPLPGEEGNG